jgi:signal recognition particle receptor subunit beta
MPVEPAFRKFIVVIMGSSESGVTEFISQVSELQPQTVPDPNPSDTLKPLDYGRLTVDNANVIYRHGSS